MKLLFIPVSIGSGLAAGALAKKLFDVVWGLVDDEEPPKPEHRDVSWGKLLTALAVQGAIFRVVRGVMERGSRKSVAALTGSWPGEAKPDPK